MRWSWRRRISCLFSIKLHHHNGISCGQEREISLFSFFYKKKKKECAPTNTWKSHEVALPQILQDVHTTAVAPWSSRPLIFPLRVEPTFSGVFFGLRSIENINGWTAWKNELQRGRGKEGIGAHSVVHVGRWHWEVWGGDIDGTKLDSQGGNGGLIDTKYSEWKALSIHIR